VIDRLRNLRGPAVTAAVALAVGSAACQQRQVEDGGLDADTAATRADTAMDAAAPGLDAGGGDAVAGAEAGSVEIAVTNPMPHAMVVKADWGSGETELGTVQPGETASFEVSAPAGTQVSLSASDPAASHAVSGTVTVEADAPASWTIQ
jgi:hypothetical protein